MSGVIALVYVGVEDVTDAPKSAADDCRRKHGQRRLAADVNHFGSLGDGNAVDGNVHKISIHREERKERKDLKGFSWRTLRALRFKNLGGYREHKQRNDFNHLHSHAEDIACDAVDAGLCQAQDQCRRD